MSAQPSAELGAARRDRMHAVSCLHWVPRGGIPLLGLAVMPFLLRRWHVARSWPDLLRRTLSEAFFHDNCLALAAQLAYYFFFALFPTLLVLVAVARFFPLSSLVDDTVWLFGPFAPPECWRSLPTSCASCRAGTKVAC